MDKMKILVATNKYDTEYYRYSTPAEQAVAALALFKVNDGLSYYTDIEDRSEHLASQADVDELQAEIDKALAADISDNYIHKLRIKLSSRKHELIRFQVQHELYVKAKAGDAVAAHKLLECRKDYEYEGWDVKEVK